MKYLLSLFIATVIMSQLSAQKREPKSQFGKDIMPVWQVGIDNTIAVAEAMPADLYNYRPTDSSKTFADQIAHIAFTCKFLSEGFVNNNWIQYGDPDTKGMTKNEIIEMLKAEFELATANIRAMTDEQAEESVKAFGGRILKRYVTVLFIQDHLTNHRAKANLYIRMNGIVPPDYGYFN